MGVLSPSCIDTNKCCELWSIGGEIEGVMAYWVVANCGDALAMLSEEEEQCKKINDLMCEEEE
jgi:hypothetical protein